MKYQLVLQFPASSVEDYDEMIALEETIIKGLGNLGNVDGHDAGSGEMNIFVITDQPQLAFEKIKSLLGSKNIMPGLKVAYRVVGTNKFTIIYPANLTSFAVA